MGKCYQVQFWGLLSPSWELPILPLKVEGAVQIALPLAPFLLEETLELLCPP